MTAGAARMLTIHSIKIECDIQDLPIVLRVLAALSPESPINAQNTIPDHSSLHSVTIEIPNVYAGFQRFPSNP